MERQSRPGRNIDDNFTTTIVTIVRILYQNSLHLERILMLDQIDDNSDDIGECFPMAL